MSEKQTDAHFGNIYFEVCGRWLGIMSGALSAIFQSFGFYLPTSYAQATFSTLAFVALWVCVFTIARKSYLIMKPVLKFELIPPDPKPIREHACQIAVCNNSLMRSAENIEAELVWLDDELSKDDAAPNILGNRFPRSIKPEKHTQIINAGSQIIFTILYATSDFIMDGQGKKLYAKFDLGTPFAGNNGNMALFRENQSYPMKIKVSAKDMPKLEAEFNLTVSVQNGNSIPRLTPVIK